MKLEEFRAEDIQELLGWLADTDEEFLIQFAGPAYNFPLDTNQLAETLMDDSNFSFRAVDETSGRPIGHCQLMRIDRQDKSAAIGRIFIRKEFRGRGYGREMTEKLVEYARDAFGLSTLTLNVFDFNRSAYSCYKNLGFTETGTSEKYFDAIGKTWKVISMKKIID